MNPNGRLPGRFPQLAKEPLIRSLLKASPENRVFAKIIDFFLLEIFLFFVSYFSHLAVWILIPLYWGSVERLGRGQSPGKWLLGLHTIEVDRGFRPSFYQSLLRNFLFAILSYAFFVNSSFNFLIAGFALSLILIETYFIFNLKSGIRFSDILASTRVADYKDEHTKFVEQFLKEEEYQGALN